MKRTLLALCAVGFLSGSPAFAQSVEYKFIKAQGANWRDNAIAFINENKPDPASVSGGFSGDTDLHIFVKPGSFPGKYRFTSYKAGAKATIEWVQISKDLVAGGKGKVFGFSGPDVWILMWD